MNKLMLTVVAVTLCAVAQADEVRTETLKFPELNLANSKGIEALYHRIMAAAARVCPNDGGVRLDGSSVAHCKLEAARGAVMNIHNSALSAYWMKMVYHTDQVVKK